MTTILTRVALAGDDHDGQPSPPNRSLTALPVRY
jgi:hypothetical protein